MSRLLDDQISDLLSNAVFSDSIIADRLAEHQRTVVEDRAAGLVGSGCSDIIIKGVLLTDSPHASNPMSMVLGSLQAKIDRAKLSADGEELPSTEVRRINVIEEDVVYNNDENDDVERASGPSRDPMSIDADNVASGTKRRKHKVYIEATLINEYKDNPELIGGAFADLLPLGFTKDDLGKGGTLPKKLIKT